MKRETWELGGVPQGGLKAQTLMNPQILTFVCLSQDSNVQQIVVSISTMTLHRLHIRRLARVDSSLN